MCAGLPKSDVGEFLSHESEVVFCNRTGVESAPKRDEIHKRSNLSGTATASSLGGGELRCARLLAVRLIPLSAITLREPVQAIGVVSALSRLPRLKSTEHAPDAIHLTALHDLQRRRVEPSKAEFGCFSQRPTRAGSMTRERPSRRRSVFTSAFSCLADDGSP